MAIERAERRALTVAVAAALLLRVALLGAADLWTDEVHTFDAMRGPAADVAGERLAAGHVPLYFLALRGWTALAGTSQLALRLPSALAGAALVVPVYLLVRRLAGVPAARWAALLAAVHPLLVELSREARMYAFAGLLLAVLAESAVASLDDGRVRRRFWVAAALGPLTASSWAFAALPLAAWAAIERRAAPAERRRAATAVAAGCLASVVLLGVALLAATPQRQELTRRAWPLELLVFALRPYLGERPSNWFPTGGLAVVTWALALWTGLRAAAPRARRLALWLAAGVPAASLVAGVAGHVPWGPGRYVHAAALGAIVAAAASAGAETGAVLRTVATLARSFLAATLFLLSLMVVGRPNVAWSDAAARAARDVPPGDVLWVDDESARILLAHYSGRDVRVGRPAGAGEHWRARLERTDFGPVVRVERRAER